MWLTWTVWTDLKHLSKHIKKHKRSKVYRENCKLAVPRKISIVAQRDEEQGSVVGRRSEASDKNWRIWSQIVEGCGACESSVWGHDDCFIRQTGNFPRSGRLNGIIPFIFAAPTRRREHSWYHRKLECCVVFDTSCLKFTCSLEMGIVNTLFVILRGKWNYYCGIQVIFCWRCRASKHASSVCACGCRVTERKPAGWSCLTWLTNRINYPTIIAELVLSSQLTGSATWAQETHRKHTDQID